MDNNSENKARGRLEVPMDQQRADILRVEKGQSFDEIETGERAKEIVELTEADGNNEDNEAGVYDDRNKNFKGNGTALGARKPQIGIQAQPPIAEMIKQTVMAIEDELRKNENEMKTLLNDQKSPAYVVNLKAKQIRFLNGVLNDLKNAAKVAEDFIVGLWKQYVKKV